MYILISMYMYVCVYIYIYIYRYTHLFMYIYILELMINTLFAVWHLPPLQPCPRCARNHNACSQMFFAHW